MFEAPLASTSPLLAFRSAAEIELAPLASYSARLAVPEIATLEAPEQSTSTFLALTLTEALEAPEQSMEKLLALTLLALKEEAPEQSMSRFLLS